MDSKGKVPQIIPNHIFKTKVFRVLWAPNNRQSPKLPQHLEYEGPQGCHLWGLVTSPRTSLLRASDAESIWVKVSNKFL